VTGPARYIAVEGPIGAGKSTLARILAEAFGARLVREQPEDNPFLASFYKDRKRYALSVQLFFLVQRYAQQQDLLQGDLFSRGIVTDYLFDKDRLFAAMNLSPDELVLYDQIFTGLQPRVVKPDLVVYLQARTEVLMDRVHRRGRPEEQHITPDYLTEVAQTFARYFFDYNRGPLLIVNASEIDFVDNPEDRAALIEQVRRTKTGVNLWSRSQ